MKKIKVIILFVLILVAMKNIVLAKYFDNFNINVSNRIATPVIEISKEDIEEKTRKVTAVNGTEFLLNISNFNNSKVSEVKQVYYLKFYSDDLDMSKLNIILTNENGNIELNNGDTKPIYFNANEKETHKYNVNIKSNVNNEIVKGSVKVKLINEQVKPC